MKDVVQPEYEFDYRKAKPNRLAVGPTTQMKPLAEVTRQAIEILSRELGAADTMRFVGQFTSGHGDYTAAREELVGQATLQGIIAEIESATKAAASRGTASRRPDWAVVEHSDFLVHNSASTPGQPGWRFGGNHSAQQWRDKMSQRGWTSDQITEAIRNGQKFPAVNNVNLGNSAIRFVHPTTGRSVVVDDVTREVIHVGGDGFVY